MGSDILRVLSALWLLASAAACWPSECPEGEILVCQRIGGVPCKCICGSRCAGMFDDGTTSLGLTCNGLEPQGDTCYIESWSVPVEERQGACVPWEWATVLCVPSGPGAWRVN